MAPDNQESACPVDHTAREAWLQQARAVDAQKPKPQPSACPVDHTAQPSKSWTQSLTSYLPWTSSSQPEQLPAKPSRRDLDTDRVVSTIPRSHGSSEACPVPHGASANAELESRSHASGNWVYPSEKMFFEAMKRKGYSAVETDMKTVVPIHNAVNERAWKEIKEWEAPYLSQSKCDGPKLESFANKMERMTPTARFNTILGYTAPFDRHDWVVDRCGTRVDYVIDFYAGRPGQKGPGPSFYLDVRPKFNTWEGCKMRAMRWVGMA